MTCVVVPIHTKYIEKALYREVVRTEVTYVPSLPMESLYTNIMCGYYQNYYGGHGYGSCNYGGLGCGYACDSGYGSGFGYYY